MSRAQKARLATVGCALAAGFVLAACGGSSGGSAAASNTSPTTTTPGGTNGGGRFGTALNAFRDCMSSHGITITLPNRPRNGDRTPPTTTPGETFPPRGSFGGGFGGRGFGNFANRFETPPAGVDPATYKTALDSCRSKLPTGGGFPNNSAFQAYRSCLQDHGVTLPSSNSAASGNSFNRNDPKVQAAMKTCAPLLPAGFGRRGGFGSTTTTTVGA
jgi:hypothetical protein